MAQIVVVAPPRAARRLIGGLVAVVLVLTAFGAALAVKTVLAGPAAVTIPILSGPGPFAVGDPVRSNDGVLVVIGTERVAGPSHEDLGGATHGIQNLVDPTQTQVQVTMRLTNDGSSARPFTPADFQLRADDGKPVAALAGSLPSDQLRPGTSVEGTLGFVAPRSAKRLILTVAGASGSTAVDLGASRVLTDPGSTSHRH